MSSPLTDLCYPTYDFRFRNEHVNLEIFDELRKKWIVCTPEEWVRQNLVKFLISEYKFPMNLFAIEKSLVMAGRNYRFDVLIYNKEVKPLMIIECKAPAVRLEQKVFDQIWNYNYEINAPFFLITNGVNFVMGACSKNSGIKFFTEAKSFEELISEVF